MLVCWSDLWGITISGIPTIFKASALQAGRWLAHQYNDDAMVGTTGAAAMYLTLWMILSSMSHSSSLRMSPHPLPNAKRARSVPTPPPTEEGPIPSIIDLAFVENQGQGSSATCSDGGPTTRPTTLLIHGLDSSSHTWRGVQEGLSTPSIAIDCRGCGRSELGDPQDFTPEAIADDIKRLADAHPLLQDNKFVVVGHSMGGRVGMCYAAKYPGDVAALVVEDMDTRRRSVQSNFIPEFDEVKAIAFDRQQSSMDSLRDAFGDIGYPSDMVEKWIGEGRVYNVEVEEGNEKVQRVWSDVNPAFRALCYRTIFDSDCGTEAWSTIANHVKRANHDIALYLMVAGIGTVCDDASIDDMKKTMGDCLSVKTYSEGTHSIHNSARNEFMADLKEVIEGMSVQRKER